MRRTCGASLLALAVVLAAPGSAPGFFAESAPTPAAGPRVDLPVTFLPATGPEAPVVVDAHLPATAGWSAVRAAVTVTDLHTEMISAYSFAVAVAPRGCHLRWSLLAAIGQVESGNAAGHQIDARHRVVPAIIGPVLNGTTTAAVPDTDEGTLDGDRTWDRAVGPFQFIPSSWRVAGVDFDHDGVRDPQDVYDAAGAAMVYLCAGGRDLDDPLQLRAAVLSYNHSARYLRSVLAQQAAFDRSGPWGPSTEPPAATVLARAHVTPAVSAPAEHPAEHPAAHPAATSPHGATPPVTAPSAPPAVVAPPAEPGAADEPTAPAGTDDPGGPPCPAGPPTDPPADPPADPVDTSPEVPPGNPVAPSVASPELPVEPPAEAPTDPPSTPAPVAPDPCAPAEEPAQEPDLEPGVDDPTTPTPDPTPAPVELVAKPEA